MMSCLLLVANANPMTTYHIHHLKFQIPVNVDPSRRDSIREILLYRAGADGQWTMLGRAVPGSEKFEFTAPEDGAYYFRVDIIDKRTGAQEVAVTNCIVVDTSKPILQVRSAERQGDEVTVRWDLIEKNPDFATFKLEYRDSDSPAAPWLEVPVAAPQMG